MDSLNSFINLNQIAYTPEVPTNKTETNTKPTDTENTRETLGGFSRCFTSNASGNSEIAQAEPQTQTSLNGQMRNVNKFPKGYENAQTLYNKFKDAPCWRKLLERTRAKSR